MDKCSKYFSSWENDRSWTGMKTWCKVEEKTQSQGRSARGCDRKRDPKGEPLKGFWTRPTDQMRATQENKGTPGSNTCCQGNATKGASQSCIGARQEQAHTAKCAFSKRCLSVYSSSGGECRCRQEKLVQDRLVHLHLRWNTPRSDHTFHSAREDEFDASRSWSARERVVIRSMEDDPGKRENALVRGWGVCTLSCLTRRMWRITAMSENACDVDGRGFN